MSLRHTINDITARINNPEAQVDELYLALEQPGYDWGAPDVNEFKYVLNTFATWVAAENKADMVGPSSPASRAKLIRYIKEQIPTRPTFAFLDINPAIFGIQLAMRVRRPRSIDQGDTGLCGAVSAVYSFAKTKPQEFTQFALDLFFKGQAILGQMDITPSMNVRQGYRLRKNKIPWAVDYVTLVSLRQCAFFSDKLGIGAIRGADETTLPGKLAIWLRDAGFSDVQDHTFFGKNQQKAVKAFAKAIGQSMHLPQATGDALARTDRLTNAAQNLLQASQSVALGKIVLLFADGELAVALRDSTSRTLAERPQPTALGEHHWMAVRKLDVFGDTLVKLKAVTWGNVYQGVFDRGAFLSRYNGFVSATP